MSQKSAGLILAAVGSVRNESLEIIKGVLNGDSVTFEGREFAVTDAVIKPTPRVPIPY